MVGDISISESSGQVRLAVGKLSINQLVENNKRPFTLARENFLFCITPWLRVTKRWTLIPLGTSLMFSTKVAAVKVMPIVIL